MPKRRRRPVPDTRLDWRDPNLPCFYQRLDGGEDKLGPKAVSEIHKDSLENAPAPDWRNDPTYNLRKRNA